MELVLPALAMWCRRLRSALMGFLPRKRQAPVGVYLTIRDPREGGQFKLVDSKRVLFDAAHHDWLVLTGDSSTLSRSGRLICDVCQRVSGAYGCHDMVVQFGPPMYGPVWKGETPDGWRLINKPEGAEVYHVDATRLEPLAWLWERGAAYEMWTILFASEGPSAQESLSLPPFDPSWLVTSPVTWHAVFWVDADSLVVTGLLTRQEVTRALIRQLISAGLAK